MRSHRRHLVFGIVILVLIIAGIAAYLGAVHMLGRQVASAFGKGGEIGAIHVGLGGVDIENLRVRARNGKGRPHWPTEDELNAEHIHVEPDLRSLLSDKVIIRAVTVSHARMTILRDHKGLQILPGLRSTSQSGNSPSAAESTADKKKGGSTVLIGSIRLENCSIDFFDATVRRNPYHIELKQITASLEDLSLPEMRTRSALKLNARVAQDGQVSLSGWLTPASADSELKLRLKDIPVRTIEPYLIRKTSSHVKSGTLDLELNSNVQQQRLKAPGRLTLTNLSLSGTGGLAGIGQEAIIALLRDRSRKISLDFTLNGRLDDPKFSLNDEFYLRIGTALADSAGVGLSNLGHSVGKGLGGLLKELTGN